MSSRYDRSRRDGDRDRGSRYVDRDAPTRRSRSRSPYRGDRGRGGRPPADRRDYDRSNRDRDYPRDDRRRDDRDRDRRDHRDDRRDAKPYDREPPRRDADRERDRTRDRDPARDREPHRGAERINDTPTRTTPRVDEKRPSEVAHDGRQPSSQPEEPKPRQVSEVPTDDIEEGEEMDATNEDDAAMMAMMGLTGFGTTKGKHVEGNQEGTVDVKKMRTWRQYMNRRGGFNRPLDKIK